MSVALNSFSPADASSARDYTFVRFSPMGMMSPERNPKFRISGLFCLDASGNPMVPVGINVSDVGVGNPLNIVDGNAETGWESGSANPYVELVYPSAFGLTAVNLKQYVIQSIRTPDDVINEPQHMANRWILGIHTAGTPASQSQTIVHNQADSFLFPNGMSIVLRQSQTHPSFWPSEQWTSAPVIPLANIVNGGNVTSAAVTVIGLDIFLTWKDSSVNSYTVEMSAAGGPYQAVSKGNTSRSFNVKKATPGTQYAFRVRRTGALDYAAVITTTSGVAPVSVPSVPQRVTAKGIGAGSITVKWSYSAADEDWFVIRRGVPNTGNSYSQIVEFILPMNSTSFVDSPVAGGAIYGYSVKARNQQGDSAWSDWVDAHSLTQVDVDNTALVAKLTGGQPITMTEAIKVLIGVKYLNAGNTDIISRVVALINNGGKYSDFVGLGLTRSESIPIALLSQTVRDDLELANKLLQQAHSLLNAHPQWAAAFLSWARGTGGAVSASIDSVIAAADTLAEKQAIVTWMRTHGYMT